MGAKKNGQSYVSTNPMRPFWRHLTDKERDEISDRYVEFDAPAHPDPDINRRLQNLTGPRSKEGKMRSLENLRPGTPEPPVPRTHGAYIKQILNEHEQVFYDSMKAKYLEDYELNESADEIVLNMVLMETLNYYRLMRYRAEKPTANIDKAIDACQRRLLSNIDALGASRKQRQGTTVNVQHSIAELGVLVQAHLDSEDEAKQLEEERMLMQKKQEEGMRQIYDEDIIDAEFTIKEENSQED